MKKKLKDLSYRYFLLVIVIILFVVATCLNNQFISSNNMITLLTTTSFVAMIACGLMLTIMAGAMDFSFAEQATLSAMLMGKILDLQIVNNFWLASIMGIVITMSLAMLCGLCVVKLQMPSFITTIAMSLIMKAITHWCSAAKNLFSNNWGEEFRIFATAKLGPFTLQIIIALVVLIVMFLVLEKTKIGRYFYAVGVNPVACAQSGIKVDKVKLTAIAMCSFICCTAGIMQASVYNMCSITAGGDYQVAGLCVTAMCTAFYKPRRHNVPGVAVSALLVCTITNACLNLGANVSIQNLAQAVVLLIAITLIIKIYKCSFPPIRFN